MVWSREKKRLSAREEATEAAVHDRVLFARAGFEFEEKGSS
jgi:hypothetical protein